MSFKNKVVIVTGASSGIGASIAVNFAKEGANVVMVARNENNLKSVADKCQEFGVKPLLIKADVSKDEESRKIIDKTIDTYGKLDVLINNAGFLKCGSILEGTAVAVFDEMLKTNLRAIMNLTTLAAPHLIKTKGNIVNISSVSGSCNLKIPALIPYSVTKTALNRFSEGAAVELASHGVRVNVISPGPVDTNFLGSAGIEGTWTDFQFDIPLKRDAKPQDISNLVLFIASEKAESITGAVIASDNGFLLTF